MDKHEANMILPELPEVPNTRAEKRAQLRHYKKTLAQHKANMPTFDINEKSTLKRQQMQMAIVAWGERKMRLELRIRELSPKKPGNAS